METSQEHSAYNFTDKQSQKNTLPESTTFLWNA